MGGQELPERKTLGQVLDEIETRHNLLSLSFSYFVGHSSNLGIRVESISSLDRGIPELLLRDLDGKGITRVIPLLASDHISYASSQPGSNYGNYPEESLLIAVDAGNPFRENLPEGTKVLLIRRGTPEARILEDVDLNKEEVEERMPPNISPIYPAPYYNDVNPVVILDFLNYARISGIGKSMGRIIADASEYAFRLSVGEDQSQIRSGINSLVRVMDKLGIINSSRGKLASDLGSRAFKLRFMRAHNRYLERLGKKTIFDFERLV